MFLVRTIEMTELILNAVALGVVLHEMLFMVLRPEGTKGTLCALMAAVLSIFVGAQVGTMRDVARVMCDGKQTFLGVKLASGPVFTGPLMKER